MGTNREKHRWLKWIVPPVMTGLGILNVRPLPTLCGLMDVSGSNRFRFYCLPISTPSAPPLDRNEMKWWSYGGWRSCTPSAAVAYVLSSGQVDGTQEMWTSFILKRLTMLIFYPNLRKSFLHITLQGTSVELLKQLCLRCSCLIRQVSNLNYCTDDEELQLHIVMWIILYKMYNFLDHIDAFVCNL